MKVCDSVLMIVRFAGRYWHAVNCNLLSWMKMLLFMEVMERQ